MVMQYKFIEDYKVDPHRATSLNVDGCNGERAALVSIALEAFRAVCPTDDGDLLGDFLCNLRHWAEANGQDFEQANRKAEMHWEAETGRAPY